MARSMFEGGDEYRDYLLNDEGKLEFTQEYNESLLDIELDSQALPPDSGLDTLTFHWFYPGKWFDKLKINRELSPWTAKILNETAGNVTFEVTYDPPLVPVSASVGFTKLLGHIFEGPKMGSFPEATVTVQKKGLAHFTFHMHTFFEKWMNNFSTPYQVGDEFPLNLTLTFDTPFDVKSSSRKDPEFIPKEYDGRVDHTDGNPYLGVPSTNPENTLQVSVKPKLTLTETMLP
ncbi:MAG: hypothetical protein ACXACH_07765 [Candidatus Hermodarchaeia archaeon]